MSENGSYELAAHKSTSTFISALFVSSCVAGVQLVVFLVLRTSIKKIYSPRTYLPVPSKRSQPVSSAPWGWLLPTMKAPSLDMIPTAGLDAYMYLRFLKMMVLSHIHPSPLFCPVHPILMVILHRACLPFVLPIYRYIFLPTTCLTSAVLLPLNAVGTNVSSSGLDSFAFGNIPENQQIRYVGHLLCAYAVTIWVVFLVQREMSNYVDLRQKYLTSQRHLDLPQSRTVLVTGVPKKYLSTRALKHLTSHLPGGIKQVWISRELKELPKLYNERLKYSAMLEEAETKLCRIAVKTNRNLKKHISNKENDMNDSPITNGLEDQSKELDEGKNDFKNNNDLVNRYVNKKLRPKHRIGFLGLLGKKVDTINFCKERIGILNRELEVCRKNLDQHRPHNSAFIEFNERLAAQMFSQIVLYQKPLRMAKRYVDAAPEDIIWDNLNINPYDERVRKMVSWVLTIGLVIVWSFPVGFIGTLSNSTSLCTTVRWLSWLCYLQKRVQDIIQGIIPPVLLALVFLVLPPMLRLIARYSGVPRVSEIELILMTRYYIFVVVNGFVITTLTSGLAASIPALSKDAGQAVTILAENLPKASIFFMTYMVTTSLTSAAGALLQVFDLILYHLKLFVWASTPRSVFNIQYTMSRPQFGTLFPNTTLLATIGLAYSIIAPIMSLLALLAFSLYWLAYKYLFMFTFDIPAAHETGGRFFPLAMNHVFIGLYFSQGCLTALFFLARNAKNDPSSIPQGSLMIVLNILTIFSHILIRNSYGPLTMFVPLSMMEEEEEEEEEEGDSLIESERNSDEVRRSLDSSSKSRRSEDERKIKKKKWFPKKKDDDEEEEVGMKPLTNKKKMSEDENFRTKSDGRRSEEGIKKMIEGWKENVKETERKKRSEEIGKNGCGSETIIEEVEEPPNEINERFRRPVLSEIRRPSSKSMNVIETFPEQGRTAFLHPAVWENLRPIWVPEDPIGVAQLEVIDMRKRKIYASMRGAEMDWRGKVTVTRSPPENAEVIELKKKKVEGIFALPGAIGGVARAAVGGVMMMNSISRPHHQSRYHARKASEMSSVTKDERQDENQRKRSQSSSQSH